MSGENAAEQSQLGVGDLAYDTARDALGVVMDTGTGPGDGPYSLRPPRGGVEWTASREDIRLATATDRLRPALAERNAHSSRWGAAWG
ncbi:hypothetical protein ACWEFL_17275 [Streptomyces sp. NPDC004838]